MAQRLQTILECDLDNDGERRPAETVTFYSSTGMQHEIEVCEEHRKDIDEVLEAIDSFTGHARRIGPNAPQRRQQAVAPAPAKANGRSRGNADYDAKAVREWAQSQGIEVSGRGRISATVLEQYRAATQ